ncbi:hypothetical protein GCM10020256_02410 [Streptomyces thermocoprophilus]
MREVPAGCAEFRGDVLRQVDRAGGPLGPYASRGGGVRSGRPQVGGGVGQQCAEEGEGGAVGEAVQQFVAQFGLAALQSGGGGGLVGEAVRLPGEQQGRLDGTEGVAGGGGEGGRCVRLPGGRALGADECGHLGQFLGGEHGGERRLAFQCEMRDRAELAGRVVVEGQPFHASAAAVDALAAEDDDGAPVAAQHLSDPLVVLVRLAEDDLAQRSPWCGQGAVGDGFEQQGGGPAGGGPAGPGRRRGRRGGAGPPAGAARAGRCRARWSRRNAIRRPARWCGGPRAGVCRRRDGRTARG